MVKKKILVTTVIVVIVALVAGYVVGQFLAPSEQTDTTTITEIQTITTTSISRITETVTSATTSSSAVSKIYFPLQPIEPNGQIVGIMSKKGHALVTLSINGSIFIQGETVNITATVTNLTPQNITVHLIEFHLPIFRSQGSEVWRSPISYWPGGTGLRPQWTRDFDLKPFESAKIPYATTNWNLTGLKVSNETNRITYSGELVPEGKYKIDWEFGIEIISENNRDGGFDQLILEFNVESPPLRLISMEDALNIVAKFKGWNVTELESFKVFTEIRYLKENGNWLSMYIVDPENDYHLKYVTSYELIISDPIVNLRGYFWFVSINTNPERPVKEAELYSYAFWVNALDATIMYSTSPLIR